ncbi:MAG: hypothetical protein ACHP9T_00005 [Caulobacterales bacterium]
MSVVTFYLCKLDGSESSFEAFELGSDVEAPDRANAMLAEHLNCAFVAVWQEKRTVLTQQRRPPSVAVRCDGTGMAL